MKQTWLRVGWLALLMMAALAGRADASCWNSGGVSGSACYGYPTPSSCNFTPPATGVGVIGCCCYAASAGRACDEANNAATGCPDLVTNRLYCGSIHNPCAAGLGCSDGLCTACATGTWAAATSTSCMTWSPTCAAGTFQSAAPSATADRVCTPCVNGFSAAGATSCTPWTMCAAGQHQATAPSTTLDRTCAPCATGSFSAAGATTCTPWSPPCGSGFYESTTPTAAIDRACSALTVCGANEYEWVAATATSDRGCTACRVCTTGIKTACTRAANTVCAGPDDAGAGDAASASPDGGTSGPGDGGCGCTTGAGSGAGAAGWPLVLLGIALLVRRSAHRP